LEKQKRLEETNRALKAENDKLKANASLSSRNPNVVASLK
jgi:hypothetical protein